MSNEGLNIQNQERNRNAEEGPSRSLNKVLDYDGQVIDLNHSPKNK